MSKIERHNEGVEKKAVAGSQDKPESLSFAEIMKGRGDRQPKAGDTRTSTGDYALLTDASVKNQIEKLRNNLPPEFAALVKQITSVPLELRQSGITDPVKLSQETAAKQQEHMKEVETRIAKLPAGEQQEYFKRVSDFATGMAEVLKQVVPS